MWVLDKIQIKNIYIYIYLVNNVLSIRNRAIHGDVVVVELLLKSQWKGRSISIRNGEEGNSSFLQKLVVRIMCKSHFTAHYDPRFKNLGILN